ncbi:unnamed protein product [Symbiodinium sp. KB8]|nr:unnamed protein product [Symbiodinium sp. KB8]
MQVTAFSGDSDMYVSINADVSMPNPQNGFDFFSISFFNDTVHLSPTTLQPCFEQADALGLQGCTIYTSVYGFRAAQYSIVAQVGAEGEVLLVDGTPQQGNVAEGEYAYFKALVDFPADALQGYSVTVTPRSGDPDLYVITTRDELPSSQNFDRRSIGFGRETVSFSPGTEFYEAKTTVHIAVYGWQTGADFDIVFATASKDETLQDGKQSQVTLDAGSSAFFRFPMYTDAADLQYAISSLSGDVNFYITLPDNVTSSTVPGPSNYIWQGNAAGAGVANTIKRSDPAFRSGVDYLFGLYNPSTTVKVTATIVAHVSTTIVSLTAGSPQLGGVSAGAPLPTLENNVWSSDDGTSQDQYTIVIPAGDPKHTAGQTTFTIGVYGWLSTVAFNVLVSTSEVPTILRVGTPSARVSVAAGDTKHFMAYIDDTSVDLIATVTPLSGDPDILISSRNTNPYCVQAGSRARALAPWAGKTPLLQDFMPSDVATVSDTLGAKLRTCYGARWYTSNEGDGAPDVLTISAASPCDGPNVNRTGCVPALDWRPGLFYIGIFATTTTQFSVTLYSDGLTSLNGGQAAQGQARKLSPVYFVFTDQNSGSNSTHDLKVTISRNTASGAHTWPLLVFMNSCLRSQCTADDRHPSAGHHEPGGVFQVGSDRTDFFITPQDALACVPVDGDECQYYFAVSAECAGGVHAAVCKQSFYITVTVQDGDSVETVPFSQINGRVNVMQGSAPIGTIPKFEMFLGGEEPTDVIMHLDSCGVDYSGVYVCDPSKTGQDACQDAFNPSSNDHTAGNMSSSATRGSAVVNIQGTTAQSLYVGVQNSGQPQQVTLQLPRGDVVHTHLGRRSLEGAGLVLGATAPVYEFELDVFTSTAYVLEQPDSPGVSVDHEQGTSASVSWQPAKLVQPSTGAELVLQQAEYTVFAGQGGFSGAALQEGIPTTPCGMERWFAQLDSCAEGSTEGHCGSVTARAEQGQTSVVVGGLVPNTAYEFAVMVTCDVACWAAAFPGNSSTNHAEQRMLYPSTASANSGAASSRKAPKQPLAPGITAVIVLSVLLAVVAVVAFVWWRRRTVARAQNQYTVMGGDDGYSGHSGTPSAPADTSATSYGRLVDDEGAGDVEFRDRLAQYMDQ